MKKEMEENPYALQGLDKSSEEKSSEFLEENLYASPNTFLEKNSIYSEIRLKPTLLQMAFSFEGRIRRSEYWLWSILIPSLGFVLLIFTAVTLGLLFETQNNEEEIIELIFGFSGLIFFIIYGWSYLALGVKRLHDLDQSGLLFLVAFVPLLGYLFTWVYLGFVEGENMPNQYGLPAKL